MSEEKPIRLSDIGEAEYERLYKTLVRYFEWKGTSNSEDLAQATLARVLDKLSAVEEVTELSKFAFGVARNILKEERKSRKPHEALPSDILDPSSVPNPFLQQENQLLLREVLGALSPEERQLLCEYYTEDREEVAKRLNMTPNGIRLRVFRIKAKLAHILAPRKTDGP